MTTDPLLESAGRERGRPTRAELAARLTSAGFGAAWSTLKSVPPPVADRLFRAAADLAVRRRGAGVVQYARNMLRVLGEQATPASLAAVTRAGVHSYARYWRETFQVPGRDLHTLGLDLARSTIGLEHLDRAQEEGRGTILALPHSGNWDVAGLMITERYGALTVIVERLEPESLYAKFTAFRELLGMEVVPLTGPSVGGRATPPDVNPSQVLRERLRQGRIIALLADRDLSSSGVPVTFFGEPTRMPAGPAMLAAVTGADLCPTNLHFTDDGWVHHINAPMELPGTRLAQQVRQATQRIAEVFEVGIADHPADWHMMQPLWLADLPASHGARAGAPVGAGAAAAGRERP